MAMKRFLRYFLQGLLFVIPVGFTMYVIYGTITWVDGLIPRIFNIEKLFPGFGLIIVVGAVTVIGYLGSTLIAKPAFTVFENFIYRIPLVNLIYSSVKDVIGAFVGDKKKFNQPVLVTWNKDFNIHRIGFITQQDLKYLGIHDKVAVYFPDSYNISGNLFVVSRDHITVIHAPSSEVMKFIVSGGVSGLNH
jgi:uncharacterized membrane protein